MCNMAAKEITVSNLSKSYDGRTVFSDVTLSFLSGEISCLMGPSGAGKTTLFRILLGLERPDGGAVSGTDGLRFSAVFQEDRLCEAFSPLENVLMVFPKAAKEVREAAKNDLCKLLPEESIYRPVATLSGGMKRRVAICRALAVPFDAVLMDEPFTGLDEATKKHVIAFVKEKTAGRLAVISTHQEEDVPLLGGRLIHFSADEKRR